MNTFAGKYIYKLKFLAILLLIPVLSACIGIPIPGSSQQPIYSEDVLGSIEVERSTKTDIRTVLGDPDLVRLDGNLWIYGWSQYHWRFGGIAVYPLVPVPFPVSGALYDSYHTLFYEFDSDDVLQKYQYRKGVIPCRDDGICVKYWRDTRDNYEEIALNRMPWEFDSGQRSRFGEDYSVVQAPEDRDRDAKAFNLVSDQCGVYVSNEVYDPFFSIDELADKPMANDTYAYVELEPGTHTLEIKTYLASEDRTEWDYADSYEFSCLQGELIFFQLLGRKKPIEKIESRAEWIKALEDKRLLLVH